MPLMFIHVRVACFMACLDLQYGLPVFSSHIPVKAQ